MPRFDRTGPCGYGPMTGRGLGPCGYGQGGGYGRGMGRRFITRNEEKEMLQEEVEMLEEEMKAIKERLEELRGQE